MRKNKTVNIEEKFEELTRRIDGLATELHASDSKYGLHQIPELKKSLDSLAGRVSMRETEGRIHNEVIASLQKAVYPLAEAYAWEKMKEQKPHVNGNSAKADTGAEQS